MRKATTSTRIRLACLSLYFAPLIFIAAAGCDGGGSTKTGTVVPTSEVEKQGEKNMLEWEQSQKNAGKAPK